MILGLAGLSVFAQMPGRQVVPNIAEQLDTLLNNPAMVQAPGVTALGKNWFTLETDAHVITNEVTFRQVTAVLLDLDRQAEVFNGTKSKLTAQMVSRNAGITMFDFVTTAFAPLGIQIKTPYRATIQVLENSATKTLIEIKQTPEDSDTNKNIQNMISSRYAEEIVINGRTYTYIRIYTIDDANASILPGARGILENNAGPVNIEALQLIIAAAKNR